MTLADKPLLRDGARVRMHDGAEGTMTREGEFWRFDMTPSGGLSGRSYFSDHSMTAMVHGRRIELLGEPQEAPDPAAETPRAPTTRRGRR